MLLNRQFFALLTVLLFTAAQQVHAGTATAVNNLYYTGVNNSGSTLNNGSTDSHWSVTYAYANGVVDNATYQGAARVVGNPNNDSGWIDSNVARWIVPPGASNGYNLPGNGTTGTNVGVYVYTLTFNIAGRPGDVAGSIVGNRTSITLTLAADDHASVYVNPSLNSNGSVNASSQVGGTVNSAWGNTRSIVLQNYDNGTNADNAVFRIGTNTLVIQVTNTNSLTGSSSSTSLNASGLLVYQTGSAINISNTPVPEAGTWLPLGAALSLLAWFRFWRKKHPLPAAV